MYMPTLDLLVMLQITELALFTLTARFGLWSTKIFVLTNMILTVLYGERVVKIFGADTSVANLFYASSFLGLFYLYKRFNRKEVTDVISALFVFSITLALLGYVAIHLPVEPFNHSAQNSLKYLSDGWNHLSFASFISFYISTEFMMAIADVLKDKAIAVSKVFSMFGAQLVDILIFSSLAFATLLTKEQVITGIMAGFLIRIILGIIDIPVLLIALKGKDDIPRIL